MNFNEEELETIKQMAGLNRTWREIAKYLEVHATTFKNLWEDHSSDVRRAYDDGKFNTEVDIQIQVQNNALAGNLTAIQMDKEDRAQRRLQELKEIMLYGG
jgi:hypothetical protein